MVSPPAVRTPTARRPSTSTRSTRESQRISPPSAVNRLARAWVSCPAPPSGTGKPTVWPSMHISTPISPEPTASSGMSAWPALPASRRRGWSPPKSWLPTFSTGVSSSLTKSAPPAPGRPRSRPGRARTGGKGVSRPLISELADAVPGVAEPQPGCAVAGLPLVHQGRGHVTVAVQHRPRPVPERVAEHGGRVPPHQAVLLEPEGRQGPRRSRERVERAERVVHETRVHLGVAADRAADGRLGLEHQDRPAGVGQPVGRDQTVRAGADHDRVVRRAHAFIAVSSAYGSRSSGTRRHECEHTVRRRTAVRGLGSAERRVALPRLGGRGRTDARGGRPLARRGRAAAPLRRDLAGADRRPDPVSSSRSPSSCCGCGPRLGRPARPR